MKKKLYLVKWKKKHNTLLLENCSLLCLCHAVLHVKKIIYSYNLNQTILHESLSPILHACWIISLQSSINFRINFIQTLRKLVFFTILSTCTSKLWLSRPFLKAASDSATLNYLETHNFIHGGIHTRVILLRCVIL